MFILLRTLSLTSPGKATASNHEVSPIDPLRIVLTPFPGKDANDKQISQLQAKVREGGDSKAHSLTLALSTFGLVNLPSRFVEATIAASIVYVGVENLLRRDGMLRGRWLLTFVFGLIHGLGFASVLHEMGIAKTGLNAVVPLVAFNSGVEVGQLSVAALVLPIIWQIRRRPAFLRVGIPACSAFVALAGAYWLFERTLLG